MPLQVSVVDPVDQQLKAYNALDYESFVSFYAKDIQSYDIHSNSRIESMCGESFFSHYKAKFAKNPNLFCEVTERIVHGNLVIDKERITGCNNACHTEMVIYKVENGLITAMWFSEEIKEEE